MAGLSYDQLLQNLIRQESGGKANALSHAGAAGVMQVMPGTAREIAAEIGDNSLQGMNDQQIQQALMDPARGRRYGEHYLQKMLNRYGGDQAAALVAYNGGPGRADAWLKNGRNDAVLPKETSGYYRSILGEDVMLGGAGPASLPGGGGADAGMTGGGAAGSPFEGASDRQKWATWASALGQAFRGRDNTEAMQRLSALEGQGVDQNKTYQALVKRGIDPATAEWAVRDPQVMREVAQQLFAPKSKNMTISEIFDPATGRPVKVLVDQTTGEYQPIGGVQAVDPTKAPNLQAIDVFDEATGRKRKAVFNPTTGQMEPLGGIEAPDAGKTANMQVIEVYDDKTGGKRKMLFNPATGQMTPAGGVAMPDAPKESAQDKAVAARKVAMAETAIESANAANGVMPVVDELLGYAIDPKDPEGKRPNTQSGLESAIGSAQGSPAYQTTLGQLWGNPTLNAKLQNLTAKLNQELGRVYLAGLGSASENERRSVQEAIGQLPYARNREEYVFLVKQIQSSLKRRIEAGKQASQAVPNLNIFQEQPTQGITKEEYDALPSGSDYIAPDGSQRKKP